MLYQTSEIGEAFICFLAFRYVSHLYASTCSRYRFTTVTENDEMLRIFPSSIYWAHLHHLVEQLPSPSRLVGDFHNYSLTFGFQRTNNAKNWRSMRHPGGSGRSKMLPKLLRKPNCLVDVAYRNKKLCYSPNLTLLFRSVLEEHSIVRIDISMTDSEMGNTFVIRGGFSPLDTTQRQLVYILLNCMRCGKFFILWKLR